MHPKTLFLSSRLFHPHRHSSPIASFVPASSFSVLNSIFYTARQQREENTRRVDTALNIQLARGESSCLS